MQFWSTIFSLAFGVQILRISIPYILAATGGLMAERSGVVSLALEGMMLNGAFAAAALTFATGSPWLGVLAGMAVGALTALIHVMVCLRFQANQIISGVAINLLAAGSTRFLLKWIFDSSSNSPRVEGIPLLNIFPTDAAWGALLNQTIGHPLVWVTFGAVLLVHQVFKNMPFGMHVEAVGEHPVAAATLGLKVIPIRTICVLTSGVLAGLAGAWLALDQHQFTDGMSNGRGYIALAAMIFGQWRPLPVLGACLLFGTAEALQIALQSASVPIPNQFIQMLPYVLTIVALAGFMGQSRGPSALGQPYEEN
ncbi:MAG: ABC transporter permease [Candidatus Sericytochromatia bacterium]